MSPSIIPFNATANNATANSTVILDTVSSMQTDYIPFTLWYLLLLIGLGALLISILYPERGELITGIIGLSFVTMAMLHSYALATITPLSVYLSADNVLLIQPTMSVYSSAWLPLLMLILWLIAFANLLLAIANLLKQSAQPRAPLEVMR